MAVELADAYVSIVASAKGIGQSITSELGDAEDIGRTAGDKAGGGFLSLFQGKMGGLGAIITAGLGVATVGGLFKIGERFDTEFDKIRTGTGLTGDALKGLQDDFKEVVKTVPASFGDAGDAVTTLNQKLGLTGTPLQGLSEQLLNLSHVTGTDLKTNVAGVTDVFNSFGIAAGEQPAKLDELFRASQATGVSVADLSATMASAGPNLSQLGLNFEQSAGLVAIFGKAGVDVAAVLPALSKTIAAAAKNGKDAGTVFQETWDAIKNAPDDTSAAAAAIDTFGARAGPKLAGLIREGKLSYEELAASIAAGGDTINGAAADTADFAEKWTLLKNQAAAALEPLASKVFDTLSVVMSVLGDHMGAVLAVVLPLTAAFVAYKVVTLAMSAAQAVASAATAAWTVIQWLFNAAMDANPIGLVVLAIAALVAGVIYAYTHFDAFRNIIDTVWQVMQTAFHWVTDNWPLLLAILLGPFGVAILVVVKNFDAIKDAALAVWNWVSDNWPLLLAIITGPIGIAVLAITRNFDTIKDAFTAVKDWIWEKINDIVGFYVSIPGRIWGAITWIGDTIRNVIQGARDFVGTKVSEIIGFFTGLPGQLSNAFSGMFDGISRAFRSAINVVIDGWNSLHFGIPGFSAFGVNVGGFDVGVPPIRRLAAGGVVTQATLALIGERGPEAVVPLDRYDDAKGRGRGAPNITINTLGRPDAVELAREVTWQMRTAGV